MTAAALIEQLKPGEVVIRLADGSLMRTMTSDYSFVDERAESERRMMHKLTARKLQSKR